MHLVGAQCLQSETTQRLLVRSNFVNHPKTAVDHTSGAAAKPIQLDEVRARIRRLNYSIRTEDACIDWVRRFVLFHDKRHSCDMGATEIEVFLTHLAIAGKASVSIRNPAKRALQFSIGRC